MALPRQRPPHRAAHAIHSFAPRHLAWGWPNGRRCGNPWCVRIPRLNLTSATAFFAALVRTVAFIISNIEGRWQSHGNRQIQGTRAGLMGTKGSARVDDAKNCFGPVWRSHCTGLTAKWWAGHKREARHGNAVAAAPRVLRASNRPIYMRQRVRTRSTCVDARGTRRAHGRGTGDGGFSDLRTKNKLVVLLHNTSAV